MNITLKPEQEALIYSKLRSGRYQTETRTKVDEGIASLECREGIDGATFVNQLLAKLKQAKEAQQSSKKNNKCGMLR